MKPMTDDEVRTVQLSVLRKFADLCDESGIDYFLTAGTLLGAIRHNGYIPWDDDIDVAMTREGYQRFLSRIEPTLEAYGLRLLSLETTPGYTIPVIKLVDSRTAAIEANSNDFESGVGLDVFILDSVPADIARTKLLLFRRKMARDLLFLKLAGKREGRSRWREGLLSAARVLLVPVPAKLLMARAMAGSGKIYGSTPYVAGLNDQYGIRTRVPGDVFSSTEDHVFEGEQLKIPAGWHEWLSALYGDYMTPPPAEQQVTHHGVTAYWVAPSGT